MYFYYFYLLSVPLQPGVRKYVIWCLVCGGILCLLGVMFLAVYFLLRSYTSTVGYFETVPPFVPATLVSLTIFLTLIFHNKKKHSIMDCWWFFISQLEQKHKKPLRILYQEQKQETIP